MELVNCAPFEALFFFLQGGSLWNGCLPLLGLGCKGGHKAKPIVLLEAKTCINSQTSIWGKDGIREWAGCMPLSPSRRGAMQCNGMAPPLVKRWGQGCSPLTWFAGTMPSARQGVMVQQLPQLLLRSDQRQSPASASIPYRSFDVELKSGQKWMPSVGSRYSTCGGVGGGVLCWL